jgi:hypothetical protein
MQKITRRPQKKKSARKRLKAANNRAARGRARNRQRKLAQKLSRMANKIDRGEYEGIKNSPLLHLNWDYVIKRSLIANSAMKKFEQKG